MTVRATACVFMMDVWIYMDVLIAVVKRDASYLAI